MFISYPEMAEIIAIIFDNNIYSQNQDFLPNRYFIQRNVIISIINKIFDVQTESKIGLFPICQEIKNKIITPTDNKQQLMNFIYNCDLCKNENLFLAFFQADQALQLTELTSKKLIIFLSSPITNFGHMIYILSNVAQKNIEMKIICFGDAIHFGNMASQELQMDNIQFLIITSSNYIEDKIYDFLTDNEYDDPELREALQKSIIER